MSEEWKRAEVLLEDIKDDVKAIAEGHSVLRREMQEMKVELKYEIKEVKDTIKFVAKELNDKIDKVDRKLEHHIMQPAHSV